MVLAALGCGQKPICGRWQQSIDDFRREYTRLLLCHDRAWEVRSNECALCSCLVSQLGDSTTRMYGYQIISFW